MTSQFGGEGRRRQLESDLVVAFARGAMRQGLRLLFAGHLNHPFGDERTGDAGAQEVLAFIDCSGLHHREDEVAREFLLQIHDIALGAARFPGLGLQALEFLLLADVGAEGDQFGFVFVLQPRQDDRGVEAARVS